MRRLLLGSLLLTIAMATSPAKAHEAVPYQERIVIGPYPVEVWVSDWPIAAERSVDFTFNPAGGIQDKTGTISFIQPDGDLYFEAPLPRHPRNRAVWGIDLIALPAPGPWTIQLTIDGPDGAGSGAFGPMNLTEQPGPPPVVSWIAGVLPPLLFLAWLLVSSLRRFPAASRRLAWSWP
ncbi:MAG: hypothetical protein M3509_07010 [Chloroflexota bacterium]|nr:hypothetical protein [Chloroflexota bacterium]